MRRAREAARPCTTPEEHLRRALAARTSATRAKYARLGLSARTPIDRTTQAMLLRQLYLAHFEARRFEEALEAARQVLALHVLEDVAHQDAARACAAGHLRLAVRVAPPSRRAFHLWTLGSVLYAAGRLDEAAGALERAQRWGTTDRPLYAGHLALVRAARGEAVRGLDRAIDALAAAPCGEGYGRFVLGRLCAHAGRRDEAIAYLDAFVRRTTSARPALALSLAAELDEARRTLSDLGAS